MTNIKIGICGRSSCGKTTISNRLVRDLGMEVKVVSLDDFFRKTGVKYRGIENWDRPDSVDFDQFRKYLLLEKEKLVLAEGFLLFVLPDISDIFDYRIFINIDSPTIFERRLLRKDKLGYLDPDYIRDVVIAESKKHEELQRSVSDIVINGDRNLEVVYQDVLSSITNFLEAKGV